MKRTLAILSYSALIVALLMTAGASFAGPENAANGSQRNVFNLDFHLKGPDDGSVKFVEGYPTENSSSPVADRFRFLSVRDEARVQVLESGLVRFTFSKPLKVRTRNSQGLESTVVYRSIDVRLSTESLATLSWLQSLKTETVLVQTSDAAYREQSFEDVVAQSPTETLKRHHELGQRMPNLSVFTGDLGLGYVDFSTFQNGEPTEASISRVSLKTLNSFEAKTGRILIEPGETSVPAETAMAYETSTVFDLKVQRALEVKRYVDAAIERSRTFSISNVMINGQKHVVLRRHNPNQNVVRPQFGRPIGECSALFESEVD